MRLPQAPYCVRARADDGFVVWSRAFEGAAVEAARFEDAIAAGIGRTLNR